MALIDSYLKKKDQIDIERSRPLLIDKYAPKKEILSVQPVVTKKPVSLIDRIKGIGKGVVQFGARVGIEAANLLTSTLDFTADFLAGQVEKRTRRPHLGVLPVGKETERSKKAADRWKNFYGTTVGEVTEKMKTFTEDLRGIDFIKPSDEWTNASTREKFTKRLPETVLNIGPGVVSSLGMFAINPAAGFAASAGSVADEVKTIAINEGVNKERAELLGLGTGLLVGWLDKIVPDEVFSPQQKKAFVSGFAKRILKAGLKETATEVIQEDIQLLAEATVREDITKNEVVLRNLMSGLGGLLGGVGAQTTVSFVNSIRSGDIGGVEEEYKKPAVVEEKPKEEVKREAIKLEPKPKGVKAATLTVRPDGTAGMFVEVEEGVRGKGIGAKTVKALEAKAIEKGVTNVSIGAFVETQGFWEKQGYSVVEGALEEKGMIKMEKNLGVALKKPSVKPKKPVKVASKTLESLARKARKYKSAEEFAKSLKTSDEFGFVGEKEIKIDLPIKNIRGRLLRMEEFRDIAERGGLPSKGREVKEPILVRVEDLTDLQNTRVDVADGHQRLRQAIANDQETIPARVFLPENAPQLTDIWNKVNAGVEKGKPAQPKKLVKEARKFKTAEEFVKKQQASFEWWKFWRNNKFVKREGDQQVLFKAAPIESPEDVVATVRGKPRLEKDKPIIPITRYEADKLEGLVVTPAKGEGTKAVVRLRILSEGESTGLEGWVLVDFPLTQPSASRNKEVVKLFNAIRADKGNRIFKQEKGIQEGLADFTSQIGRTQLIKLYNQVVTQSTKKPVIVKKPKAKEITERRIKNTRSLKDTKLALKSIRQELTEAVTEAEASAVIAAEKRAGVDVEDINKLKRIYAVTKAFQEGDIETIRASKHQDLLNRVVENVQEVHPEMDEQEAFEFALDLPTKAEEAVRTPTIRELEKKEKKLSKFLDLLKARQKELKIEADDELSREWTQALAIQEKLEKIIRVPRKQLPVGEGKEKVSRLQARLKGALEKTSQEDIEELGLTTYRQMNQEDQIARAVEYAQNNPEEALKVVRGEIDPPEGILQNSIYAALVELGQEDTDIATQIATLTATRFGQEINILKKILADNPVVMMQDIYFLTKSCSG